MEMDHGDCSFLMSSCPLTARQPYSTMDANICCAACHVFVAQVSSVQLLPCKHNLCLHCMVDHLCATRNDTTFLCKGCNRKVERYKSMRAKREELQHSPSRTQPKRTKKEVKFVTISVMIPPPPAKTDEQQHDSLANVEMARMPSTEQITQTELEMVETATQTPASDPNKVEVELEPSFDALRLLFTELTKMDRNALKRCVGKGLIVTWQTRLTLDNNGALNQPEKVCCLTHQQDSKDRKSCSLFFVEEAVKLFANLYDPLIKHQRHGRQDSLGMSPAEFLRYMQDNDDNALFHCLRALATKKVGQPSNESLKDSYRQGQLFGSYLAADILLRLENPTAEVGHAIQTIGFAMDHYSTSRALDLLSTFRLIQSARSRRQTDAKKYVEAAFQDQPIGARDLVCSMVDNAQWKVKFSKSAGTYKHWTIIALRIIPEAQLIKDGIYNDGADPSKQLSRVPVDWVNDIVKKKTQEEVLATVFLPRTEDYSALCSLLMTHLAVALETGLPSQIDDEDKAELPLLHRVFLETDIELATTGQCGSTLHDDGDILRSEHIKLQLIWTENFIRASFPIEMAFAATETQVELMEMIRRIWAIQMKAYEEDPDKGKKERPVSEVVMGYAGDGAPYVAGCRLKDADEDGRWKFIKMVFGIFHLYMENFKKANKACEDWVTVLVATYIGKNDKDATEKNIDYFINFNDPSTYEQQKGVILLAIFNHVKRCMLAAGKTEASPITIWQYMLSIAEQSPLAFSLLNLVEFWEIALLVRKAERTDNLDDALSAIRLSTSLYCVTNSTEYTRLACDVLQGWATASMLEKTILRKYFLTVKSSKGANVGLDFLHEKFVHLTRDNSGKIYHRGVTAKIEQGALCRINLVENKDIKTGINELRAGEIPCSTRHRLRTKAGTVEAKDLARVYNKVSEMLDRYGIFEQTNERRKKCEPTTDKLHSIRKAGAVLKSQLLQLFPEGLERVAVYAVRYYILTQREITRHQKDADLSDIEGTAKKSEQAREKLVALATSTTAKGLASFTKAQLLESFAELKTHAPPEAELPRDILPSDPHPTIVAMLAEYRQSLFNIKPELKDELEQRALDGFESNTTAASRKADLSCQFHSFSSCTSLTLPFAVKVYKL
jgi:hypothetical protein